MKKNLKLMTSILTNCMHNLILPKQIHIVSTFLVKCSFFWGFWVFHCHISQFIFQDLKEYTNF